MGGVAGDLGLEGLEGVEAQFAAEVLDEDDFEGLAVEVALEVEEVSFQLAGDERIVLHGGASAEVGHAVA